LTLLDLLQSQLTALFRIGLVVFLVATMLRTRGVTGTVQPLAMGVLFIAVLIPLTIGAPSNVPLAFEVGVGVVANVILLAIVLGVRALYLRLRA